MDADRYTDDDIDIAILRVGNDFVNRTGCTLQKSVVNLIQDDPAVSLVALTDFRPDMIDEVRVDVSAAYAVAAVTDSLSVVSLREVRNKRARDASTGVPCKIGFVDWTSAEVWKTPKAAGTLSIWWRPPFTAFTIGQGDESLLLNIPSDLIYPVLDAAAVILQITEPEAVEKALRFGAYNDHVLRSSGAGRGAKSADDEE